MPIRTALLSIVPPVLIALAVLFIAWRPWRKADLKPMHAASAAALALAYAVTETLVAGQWPGFPPAEQHRWLPYIALAALLATPFIMGLKGQWRACAATTLVAAAFFTLLLWSGLSHSSSRLSTLLWMATYCACTAFIQRTADVRPCGPRLPLTWLITATGASVVFLQTYSAFFALMAGSIAAVMGAFWVVTCWRPRLEVVRGIGLVFPTLLAGLILSLPATAPSGLLIMAAAATPAATLLRPFNGLKPWLATGLCAAAAAVFCILGIWNSPGGFDFGGY